MADTVHLVVEQGPDRGKTLTIPARGARIGRSSRNDITLSDPLMSRHHCRFLFKDGVLAVADLGSANQTLVNDQPATECVLKNGDRVTLGDNVLRVAHAGVLAGGAVVDLGLRAGEAPTTAARSLGRGPLLIVGGIAILAALAVWVPKLLPGRAAPEPAVEPLAAPSAEAVEIAYEKVEATADNIFRYHLVLTADSVLTVQIDDIMNDRHVRKEKAVDPDYAQAIGEAIVEAGFFGLGDEYQGIQPDVYDAWDLSVTIGRRTHRTRVINRVEPDAFRETRELIEECGKNECGLWAIQFSPEKLQVMALEANLEGKRLYDGREVEYGNLAAAIRSFDEAQWYLETVEPKPDYYADMLTAAERAREELQQRYDDRNFRAERAIRVREWENAAMELRVILETVPDRSDERHRKARRKLLDVENRLRTQS